MHIGTLLLGAVSPAADEEFLYAGKFAGEAGRVLEAVGISASGKSSEIVLSEFQRGGFLLAHLVECPLETRTNGQVSVEPLLAQRISPVMARIRRSLKPKRIVLISESLAPLLSKLNNTELGSPVILDEGQPFALDASGSIEGIQRLREALEASASGR